MFNKLKSSYWFNFLAICGWICFIAFCRFAGPYIYNDIFIGGTPRTIAIGFISLIISIFATLSLVISFFIYIVEIYFSLKIKNEKFLNNKIVMISQIIGIIFEIIPLLFASVVLFGMFFEITKTHLHF